MGEQLDRAQAWALLTEFNQDPFHLHHARTVEGVMRYFAQELGYGDEVDFWGIVGLLCLLSILPIDGVSAVWMSASSMPQPATATASRSTSCRSMRWKRCSTRPMS